MMLWLTSRETKSVSHWATFFHSFSIVAVPTSPLPTPSLCINSQLQWHCSKFWFFPFPTSCHDFSSRSVRRLRRLLACLPLFSFSLLFPSHLAKFPRRQVENVSRLWRDIKLTRWIDITIHDGWRSHASLYVHTFRKRKGFSQGLWLSMLEPTHV